MALSDSKDYTQSVTAAEIIALALRRLGVYDPDETIDSTEETNALESLNLMVKQWSAYGMSTWLRQNAALWLTDPGDKYIYSLGPSGDNAAYQWAETELTADASSSATSITVDTVNSTHTVDTANIGVRLDNGDIHWTTISGAPSGSTVTLSSSLPSAASSGNRVYTYATTYQISRPKRILTANRVTHDTTNTSVTYDEVEGIEAAIELIGLNEYRRLTDKTNTGPPVSAYYEPTRVNGTLYVWPTGTTGEDYDKILLTYEVYVDDFDATTDNAQFPPEWFNVLAWGLAAEMASEYGMPLNFITYLERKTNVLFNDLLDSDVENASVKFEIENHWNGPRY